MTAPGPRALTIRQPWAFAIAEGFKTTENRTRATKYRSEIFIHTSKAPMKGVSIVQYSRPAAVRLDELGGRGNFWNAVETIPSRFYTPPASLACSAVIATARIAGCHQATEGCCGPWGEPNAWHWDLADVQALPTPVPAKGALGLWVPSSDVIEAVHAQRELVSR